MSTPGETKQLTLREELSNRNYTQSTVRSLYTEWMPKKTSKGCAKDRNDITTTISCIMDNEGWVSIFRIFDSGIKAFRAAHHISYTMQAANQTVQFWAFGMDSIWIWSFHCYI